MSLGLPSVSSLGDLNLQPDLGNRRHGQTKSAVSQCRCDKHMVSPTTPVSARQCKDITTTTSTLIAGGRCRGH